MVRASERGNRRATIWRRATAMALPLGLLASWLPQAEAARAAPVTMTLADTGAAQTRTVPPGVTSATSAIYGAGSDGYWYYRYGGPRGRAMATLAVVPGETLTLFVGGRGGFAHTQAGVSSGLGGFKSRPFGVDRAP